MRSLKSVCQRLALYRVNRLRRLWSVEVRPTVVFEITGNREMMKEMVTTALKPAPIQMMISGAMAMTGMVWSTMA